MRTSKSAREAPKGSLWGLLFLMLVVAGVFAMHGIQATGGPADMPGVPLVNASAVHVTDSGHMGKMPSGDSSGHGHPGGQMCLALLMAAALLLLSALLVRRTMRGSTRRHTAGSARARTGRPPPTPSIHRLCVLRE